MAATRLQARRLGIFNSVFASSTPSLPTPETEFTQPGQPFGGPSPHRYTHDRSGYPLSRERFRNQTSEASDQIVWDRSWHVVTDYLTALYNHLDTSLTQNDAPARLIRVPPPSNSFYDAMKNIVQAETLLPHALDKDDLTSWFVAQSRVHFMRVVLPHLSAVSFKSETSRILGSVVEVLERTHDVYLHGLSFYVIPLEEYRPGASRAIMKTFRQDLHALISTAVLNRLSDPLYLLLSEKISVVLGVVSNETEQSRKNIDAEATRASLLAGIDSLFNIGLGGDRFQIILAEVMSQVLTKYIHNTFDKRWAAKNPIERRPLASLEITSSLGQRERKYQTSASDESATLLPHEINHATPSQSVWDLCDWIENRYSRLIVEILNKLQGSKVAWTDVEIWKDMSIGRLATLRTGELFDISKAWPNSMGALEDLRASINTPQKRLQLTNSFSTQLEERLLHPGTSTLQILRTYISMIRSFHSLDHSKVLLDRVAFPLQLYLCSREDTVRIIITGLLSDTEDSDGKELPDGGDLLTELAKELNLGQEGPEQRADEKLDWDDMDWQPDPVDAGPGYKRSKSADIIGTLIGVLGSPDIFIREFQSIVGENLLRHEDEFDKELKLLELLKSRFGDGPLQSCEVMVRDILTSRELNMAIRRSKNLDPSPEEMDMAARAPRTMKDTQPVSAEGQLKPSLHAKVLSRLFWPSLVTDDFKVPTEISALQNSYSAGFEAQKHSRKLTWLQTLGQATVELDLADRVIVEDVYTWQATVVWAFQSDPEDDSPLTRTVDELVEYLEMDEDMVRLALNFWAGKMVLKETSPNTYAVLETLSKADRERSNALATSHAGNQASSTDAMGAAASSKVETGIGREKGAMYWQFVQGMLKNSAMQMPVSQVGMMLKMMIPEGFPFGDEDLKAFLNEKVDEGALEVKSGKYKLKK